MQVFILKNLFFIAYVVMLFNPIVKVVFPKSDLLSCFFIGVALYLTHVLIIFIAALLVGVGVNL